MLWVLLVLAYHLREVFVLVLVLTFIWTLEA